MARSLAKASYSRYEALKREERRERRALLEQAIENTDFSMVRLGLLGIFSCIGFIITMQIEYFTCDPECLGIIRVGFIVGILAMIYGFTHIRKRR